MTVPLGGYYTRIDEMVKEALSDYRSSPDRLAGNSGPKVYAIKLAKMPKEKRNQEQVVKYTLTWEILLVHGASDLGNKGVMRVWMYEDMAAIMNYFDERGDLLTDAQVNPTNLISGFRPGTLAFDFIEERDIDKDRVSRYSLQFRHDDIITNQV